MYVSERCLGPGGLMGPILSAMLSVHQIGPQRNRPRRWTRNRPDRAVFFLTCAACRVSRRDKFLAVPTSVLGIPTHGGSKVSFRLFLFFGKKRFETNEPITEVNLLVRCQRGVPDDEEAHRPPADPLTASTHINTHAARPTRKRSKEKQDGVVRNSAHTALMGVLCHRPYATPK